jgi:hypothetical protein
VYNCYQYSCCEGRNSNVTPAKVKSVFLVTSFSKFTCDIPFSVIGMNECNSEHNCIFMGRLYLSLWATCFDLYFKFLILLNPLKHEKIQITFRKSSQHYFKIIILLYILWKTYIYLWFNTKLLRSFYLLLWKNYIYPYKNTLLLRITPVSSMYRYFNIFSWQVHHQILAFITQFRGFKPDEAVEFFRTINSQRAFLRKGSKTVGPMSLIYGMLKIPRRLWKSASRQN